MRGDLPLLMSNTSYSVRGAEYQALSTLVSRERFSPSVHLLPPACQGELFLLKRPAARAAAEVPQPSSIVATVPRVESPHSKVSCSSQ